MNFAKFIELRGRMALRLAELLTGWATRLYARASCDVARSVRPDDLLNRKD